MRRLSLTFAFLASVAYATLLSATSPAQQCQTAQHSYVRTATYAPAQKVVAQEVAVSPLYVTVPVEAHAVPYYAYNVPYYYSASDAYREKAYLREVLREELRSLLQAGGQQAQQTQRAAPALTAPAATPPPATKEAVASWGPDTTTPADLQAKVMAAYQGKGNCLSCHGGGGRDAGGFKLVVDDGRGGQTLAKQSADKRWKIYGMASVGAMPPAAASDAGKAMETQHLPSLLQYTMQKD